jgi:pantetheine-phosphate adenylyltransferase
MPDESTAPAGQGDASATPEPQAPFDFDTWLGEQPDQVRSGLDAHTAALKNALPDVEARVFEGLAVDAARTAGADFIVKGLRSAGDFELEQQMAHTNFAVSGVRTVYVPCRPDLSFISSRFIREIAHYRGDVSHLVPEAVARYLKDRES